MDTQKIRVKFWLYKRKSIALRSNIDIWQFDLKSVFPWQQACGA